MLLEEDHEVMGCSDRIMHLLRLMLAGTVQRMLLLFAWALRKPFLATQTHIDLPLAFFFIIICPKWLILLNILKERDHLTSLNTERPGMVLPE